MSLDPIGSSPNQRIQRIAELGELVDRTPVRALIGHLDDETVGHQGLQVQRERLALNAGNGMANLAEP